MRLACKVPWTTHRYLVESITNCLHLKVMLASRLIKFLGSLKSSCKLGIRFLAGISELDRRTVLGRGISTIAAELGIPAAGLTPSIVKSKMKYFEVPDDQTWRVPILRELLDAKLCVPGFTEQEITTMKNFLCTS